MSNSTIVSGASGKLPFSRVVMAGGVAIVGSLIANLLVYWIGGALAQPNPDFQPLASPMPVIIFTVLFLVIATAVYAVINAAASNPVRVWTIVAWVALIVSLIPDFMLLINPAGMPMGTPTVPAVIVLIIMHFVAFAITMWAFTRWAHQR